ncbi:hypothetical protein [Helicobacter jaachi]|nr:hypothetical protein [Helicobacter jaachi]
MRFMRQCSVILGLLALYVLVGYALPLHKIEGKCVQPKDFNKNQKQVILKAFKYGAKSGFGYTMAAIAWKESCAGEYRINFADPSAGIYHAHIPGILKKHKQTDSNFMRNMVGELLIRDDDFASFTALEELTYWYKVRKGNWYEVIKSYNKGFSWEKDKERDKMAIAYFEDISRRVKDLQAYMPKLSLSAARLAKTDYALDFLHSQVRTATPNVKTDLRANADVKKQNTESKPLNASKQKPFVILEE